MKRRCLLCHRIFDDPPQGENCPDCGGYGYTEGELQRLQAEHRTAEAYVPGLGGRMPNDHLGGEP